VEQEVLEMRTVGFSFLMRAEDLVAFLQALQRENRYFNVNAIRVKNRNLLSDPAYGPPYLEVEMLLTFSRYLEGKQVSGAPAAAAASGADGAAATAFRGLLTADDEDEEDSAAQASARKPWWKRLWPL
jgi:hypothetical protein